MRELKIEDRDGTNVLVIGSQGTNDVYVVDEDVLSKFFHNIRPKYLIWECENIITRHELNPLPHDLNTRDIEGFICKHCGTVFPK